MVLEKIKELYAGGDIVGELFRNQQFIGIVAQGYIICRNSHYGFAEKSVDDYVIIQESEFDSIRLAVSKWNDLKNELWGSIAHGHSWCGYLGTSYYAPHSKKAVYVEKGKSKDKVRIGKLEEKLEDGEFSFVIERFTLCITKGKGKVIIDHYQIPLLEELFLIHKKRKESYTYSESKQISDALYA
jgi:hypothetical protein